jgi:recombination DNA repair RAD52 pathway protein
MIQAQSLARALNALTKSPQFSYVKARAAARKDENVDWPRTKLFNAAFNSEVDGCESFIMRDGSVCEWKPGAYIYAARTAR